MGDGATEDEVSVVKETLRKEREEFEALKHRMKQAVVQLRDELAKKDLDLKESKKREEQLVAKTKLAVLQLQEKHQKEVQEFKEKAKTQFVKVKQEVDHWKGQYQRLEEEELKTVKEEVASLEKRLEQKTQELKELSLQAGNQERDVSVIQNLQQKLENSNGEMQTLLASLKGKDDLLEQLRNDKTKLETSLERFKEEKSELENSLRQDLNEKAVQLETFIKERAELEDLLKQRDTEKEDLTNELRTLKEKEQPEVVDLLGIGVDQDNSNNHSYENNNNELQEKMIDEKHQDLANEELTESMKEKIKFLENDINMIREAKDAQVKRFETTTSELETEIDMLKNALAKKEQESVKLMEELEQVHVSRGESAKAGEAKVEELQEMIRELKMEHETKITTMENAFEEKRREQDTKLEESSKQRTMLEDNLTQLNSQMDSLKSMLRESEDDRKGVQFALAKANDKIDGLEKTIVEKEQAIAAVEGRFKDHEDQLAGNLNQAKLEFEENLRSLKEQQAEAVATRLELEAQIDRLQSEVDSLEQELETSRNEVVLAKTDIADKKQKTKEYQKFLEKEAKRAVQLALDKSREKHLQEVKSLQDSMAESEARWKQQVEAKDQEIAIMNEKLQQSFDSVKKETEAIKLTEKEMQAIMDAKVKETEQHKKLRQQAKQETLVLAKRLEDQSTALDLLSRSLEDILLPRSLKLSSIIQELEWNVDAAISASEAQSQQQQQPLDRLRRMSLSGGSGIVSDHDDNFSSGDEASDGEMDRQSDQASSPKELQRRVSFVEQSSARVEKLQKRIAKNQDALQRVLEKTKHICELALEEKSPWTTVAHSLRRSFEDCLVKASSVAGSTGQRAPSSTSSSSTTRQGLQSSISGSRTPRYVELQQQQSM